MKMLYILNTTNRVNNFSYSSMIAAQQLGVEFHIAGNWTGYSDNKEKEADEEKYGIRIHQIDFIRTPYDLRNIKAYKQLVQLMKREKFDVIHCNTPTGGVLGRLAGKKCKVRKIIYQAHGFHFYKGAPKKNWLIYYPIEKWLAKYTDALITINNEDYGLAKSKFQLRHNGKVYYVPGVRIDLSQYDLPDGIREKKRAELGLKETDIVLISSGELNENKNNQIIIQALSKLRHESLHYIICGTGSKYDELKKMTSDNGLDDYILFLGYRNDIKELYRASDIFVMPSLREGLSRSIMEAMASGLPCVVSNIRGNVDLIRNKKGGFLCDPRNVSSFAEAIKDCVSIYKNEFGQFNKSEVKKFDLQTVVEKLNEIYSDVII